MIFRRYWNQFRAWSDRCGCPRVMGALVFAGLLAACGQVSYTADEHIDRARQAHAEGDLRTAIIEIKNALQQDASRAEARRLLGLYNLEVGDVVAAESELTRALELGGDRDGIRLPLTRAWLLQGETDRVLEETRLADSFTEAQWPEALALRGTAFLYQGEVEQASTLFHETLQLEPNQADALMGLARIERFEGAVDAARSRLEQVLADNPQFDQAWELLGDIERQVNNLQEAETAYTQALEATHQPFSPRLKRTLTRIGLDDLDAASRDVQALERNFAQHPGVSYVRGLIAFNQERYGDARVDFEEALSRQSNYVPALLHLGITHIRLGSEQQGEQYLRRHITQAPRSVQAVYPLLGLLSEQGRVAEARRLLEDAATRFNGQNMELDVLRTRLAFAAGDDERGLALLTGLAESWPDSAELQELLGRQLIGQGDRERGMAALRQAAAMDSAPRRADVAIILSELQAGNYQEALAAARNLQEKQPDRAAPWNFIGAALMGMGRIDEAREAFQTGLELEPGYASIAMNLGNLELQTGRHQAAREVFEAIQNHSPGHADSAMRLSQLALQSGNREEGLHWLRHAIEHRPDEPRPQLLLARLQLGTGDLRAALITLDQAAEHHPEHLQINVMRAEALERLGEPAQAALVLERLVEAHPDSAELHFRLARNRSTLDDPSGSIAALRDALAADPDHVAARVALVRQLSLAGELDEARALFQPLEEAHGDRADVRAQAGWFAAERGDFAAAATQYARALDQEQRRIWVTEAYAVQRRAGHWDEAIDTLRTWLEQNRGDAEVRHLLGTALLVTDRTEEAKSLYREYLALHGDDLAALNNLAWLLREDDTAEALAYARRAHELAPDHPAILDTLGIVLLSSGAVDEAVDHLRAAHEAMPEAPGIAYNLALAYEAQGDRDEAARLLRAVLDQHEAFPEREAAEALLGRL